jgi:hypothetical protein
MERRIEPAAESTFRKRAFPLTSRERFPTSSTVGADLRERRRAQVKLTEVWPARVATSLTVWEAFHRAGPLYHQDRFSDQCLCCLLHAAEEHVEVAEALESASLIGWRITALRKAHERGVMGVPGAR